MLELLFGFSATKAEELTSYQVCDRAVLVFIIMIVYVRIGKKRFLGSATAFDAILVIMIGSIASRAISGTAPLVPSLAGTLTLILVHWMLSYFTRDMPALSYLIKGNDTRIINQGHVDSEALRAAHMSKDDLAEDLRSHGVADAKNVKDARLERSGELSVIEE